MSKEKRIDKYIDDFMALDNKHSYQAALLEYAIRSWYEIPRVNIEPWIRENIERYKEN
jgi:hypothetical protein